MDLCAQYDARVSNAIYLVQCDTVALSVELQPLPGPWPPSLIIRLIDCVVAIRIHVVFSHQLLAWLAVETLLHDLCSSSIRRF